MPKILRGSNVSNFPALSGRRLSISGKEHFLRSEWIHVRLALVEGLDGFDNFLPS
jgi:hypothetical protein